MPTQKPQHGFSNVLVLIILLLVVSFGFGAYFLLSGKLINPAGLYPQTAVASPTPTSSIRKFIGYTDPKYKFSISYPDYLTLTPSKYSKTIGGEKIYDSLSWHTGSPIHDERFNIDVFENDLSLDIEPAGSYNQFDQVYSNKLVEVNGEKIPYEESGNWISLQTIVSNGYDFNFNIYRKDPTNESSLKDFFTVLGTFKFTN